MNLKEIRKNAGFSLQVMAKVLGIPRDTYTKLENGKRRITTKMEEKIKERFFFKKEGTTVLEAKFDWVSLHFRTTDLEDLTRKILGLPLSEFAMEDYARYQYTKLYRYGNINLYVDTKDEKHGALIECSGSACRELEQILQEQKRDWYDLFNTCIVYENVLRERLLNPQGQKEDEKPSEAKPVHYFNVTRLDLALDEMYSEEGNYDLSDFADLLERGLVTMRKRTFSIQKSGKNSKEGLYNDGVTIYIGKPQSPTYFRFYEKDAERAKALKTSVESIHDLYGFKNRYEVVLREDKADTFIRDYVAQYFNIAERTVEIINANLVVFSDFKGHLDENWYALMNSRDAYKFGTEPKAFDIERVWKWAMTNVFPTMALLRRVDEGRFYEFLNEAEIPKRYQAYLARKEIADESRIKSENH